MSIIAIIGGQWGDEGKGKIVDLLSRDANMVARFQGGANAGHTVYKGNQKKIKALKSLKIRLIKTPLCNNKNFDLRKILMKVKLLGFSRIFLESGLNLTTNFLNKNLVDNFQLFISDKKLRKNGNKSFRKNMRTFLKNKKFINEKVNLFGDRLISYSIK